MKLLLALFLSTILASCATTTKQYLAIEPIAIKGDKLSEYWVSKKEEFTFQMLTKKTPKEMVNGYVKVRFLIDSNGNVFDPEIVESSPEGVWDHSGIKASTKLKYQPAKSNVNRTPVYVTKEITFSSDA